MLLISCVKHRVDWKYGTRAYRFMQTDAGFVGQNIYLVATALARSQHNGGTTSTAPAGAETHEDL